MARESTKRPGESLSPDEVRRLLHAPSRRAPTGLRNRAVMAVMYGAGLRLSEALALRPSNINFQQNNVRVLHGKNDKARTPTIFIGSILHIERWIDKRRELGLNRCPNPLCKTGPHLFCTLAGTRLSPRYVQAMMVRMGARAGIDKRVHPHGLRYTHAVTLLHGGTNLRDIQIQLGHESLATTEVYLKDVLPGDRAEKIMRMVQEI